MITQSCYLCTFEMLACLYKLFQNFHNNNVYVTCLTITVATMVMHGNGFHYLTMLCLVGGASHMFTQWRWQQLYSRRGVALARVSSSNRKVRTKALLSV